jgi:hypothetical protein
MNCIFPQQELSGIMSPSVSNSKGLGTIQGSDDSRD